MTAIEPSSLVAVLLRVPGAAEKLAKAFGKPGKDDRKRLKDFAEAVDRRHVFSVPLYVEVVEDVRGSVRFVMDTTTEARVAIEHEATQACLAYLIDRSRAFLAKWTDYETPAIPSRNRIRPPAEELSSEQLAELTRFFADYGELREQVRGVFEFLKAFCYGKLEAPSILGGEAPTVAAASPG